MDDNFAKIQAAVRQREADGKLRFEEQSKERLFKIIEKKLRTTFIGDIAAIEEQFGTLWGIDYAAKDLTEDERIFKEKWDKLRTNILDRGNAQIRGLKNELEQHTIQWDGYSYDLKIRS